MINSITTQLRADRSLMVNDPSADTRAAVLQVSWEYPPVIVGGLGRHVEALCHALQSQQYPLHVLTRSPAQGQPGSTAASGTAIEDADLSVLRADPPLHIDFASQLLDWVLAFNQSLVTASLTLDPETIEVVHAHDWLVAPAAIQIAERIGVPLVTTIHATEAGRHLGWLPDPLHRAIHTIEGQLARSSSALITCSKQMRDEVRTLHGVTEQRLHVIPNGIDQKTWRRSARPRPRPQSPVLVYAGRLVHEKGVQDIIEALPSIRAAVPGTTLLIAGTGEIEQDLRELASRRNVADAVAFHGHVDSAHLREVMSRADVAVVPSRYEPFGIVALEFTALGVPLVVTNVGGLGEFAARTGSPAVPAADPVALAAAIIQALRDPHSAAGIAEAAFRKLDDEFSWHRIAEATADVYRIAAGSPLPVKPLQVRRHPPAARGNLLYGDQPRDDARAGLAT